MYYFLNEGNLYRNPIYSRGESEGRNYSLYSLFYDILQIPSSLAETIFHTIYFKKWQKKSTKYVQKIRETFDEFFVAGSKWETVPPAGAGGDPDPGAPQEAGQGQHLQYHPHVRQL